MDKLAVDLFGSLRTTLRWVMLMPLLLLSACIDQVVDAPTGDKKPPLVIAVYEDFQAQKIQLVFNEALDSESVNRDTIVVQRSDSSTVMIDGGKSAGDLRLSSSGRLVEFFADPNRPFAEGQSYLIIIDGIRDLSGNRMQKRLGEVIFHPNTSPIDGVDNQPPQLAARTPVADATAVALDVMVTITFSEPLDCQTGQLVLQGAEGGTVQCAGQSISYIPSAVLQAETTYSVLLTGISDLAGNLAGDMSWSFTTIATTPTPPVVDPVTDTTPPQLVSQGPLPGVVDVPITATLQVGFDEEIDCSTVVLMFDEPVVAGSQSCGGSSVTFTPDAPLQNDTTYIATLKGGVADLAGNQMSGGALIWTFSTVAATNAALVTPTTYYVASNGSDSNSGSFSAPFLSLDKAVRSAAPGDVIEARAGRYAGVSITDQNAGSVAAWITLRPYQGEVVVINGGLNPGLHFSAGAPLYWRVDGLNITGSGPVVWVEGSSVEIANSDLYGGAAAIVQVDRLANEVLISNNQIHDNSALPGSNAPGVACSGSQNIRIVGNHLYSLPAAGGIFCGGNATSVVIEQNWVENVYGYGILLGGQTPASQLTAGAYETYSSVARNNLVINAEEACLAVSSSRDVKLYNNSCYNSVASRQASIYLFNQSPIASQNRGVNLRIFNNLLIGSGLQPLVAIGANALAAETELLMNNDLYWTLDGSTPTLLWSDKLGTSALAFADWQLQSGLDQNSLSRDPQLVDPLNGNFRSTSTSPVIDAGVRLSVDVLQDFDGTQRPLGGSWDIGAYEIQ